MSRSMKPFLAEITYKEWEQMQDCPVQRDTDRHIKRLRSKLKSLQESRTLCNTYAAELPDGTRIKVDGHTRTGMWRRHLLVPPRIISVTVYRVANMDEVVSLYHEFNDPSTGKDTRDKIYSIFKSFDWLPTTDSLKQGGLATALGMLGTTTEQAVSEWLDEIKELDSINISRNLLTPGYISAALLSIRYYGVAGVEFWQKYAKRLGTKINKKMDAVEYLTVKYREAKANKKLGSSGNCRENCNIALGAIKHYVESGNRLREKNWPTVDSLTFSTEKAQKN
jgi:hypothetical protein